MDQPPRSAKIGGQLIAFHFKRLRQCWLDSSCSNSPNLANVPHATGCRSSSASASRASAESNSARFPLANCCFSCCDDWLIGFPKNAGSFLRSMELVVVVPAFGAIAAEVEQLFFRLRIHMTVRKQHIRPPVVPITGAGERPSTPP